MFTFIRLNQLGSRDSRRGLGASSAEQRQVKAPETETFTAGALSGPDRSGVEGRGGPGLRVRRAGGPPWRAGGGAPHSRLGDLEPARCLLLLLPPAPSPAPPPAPAAGKTPGESAHVQLGAEIMLQGAPANAQRPPPPRGWKFPLYFSYLILVKKPCVDFTQS